MIKQKAIELLDETFNRNFEINNFSRFIKELLNEFNLNLQDKTPSIPKKYRDYIESLEKLGEWEDKKGKEVEVLVVKLKKTSSRDRARTMQRNFIASLLGETEKDAALVAFYGDDPNDWRFSYVKMEYNLVKDNSGKVKISKELTPAKRYSFLVGVNEPNHTCASQFVKLIMEEEINPSLEEIEQTFSIEKVTKEFFEKYKELFLRLTESLEKVIKEDSKARRELYNQGVDTVDFTKKLLGQIVFLYFLQKKGWLGIEKNNEGNFGAWGTGPKDFMKKLFDGSMGKYDNFFNDILEPLFYEALATERDDDYYSRFKCKIPFLNGGLFEPINDYNWRETDILIENNIFKDIFKTFDEFNFTVKEDEPLEKEVAVDPEMLGKVFENLLEVKDRKSKGAFYTPREIVHYMCQQSLINYLETNTLIGRKDIENFIINGNNYLALTLLYESKNIDATSNWTLPASIKTNYKEIDNLLKEIKIIDPAVGSGAFPIGMMNEIVKARSILSIYFKEDRKDYDLKRETIENCLYGVDIESSAVEITKLRFWLSLIVDELDMKNIKPLPNLDHKIMCGNSLLEEFEGVKLFDERLLGEARKDNSFEIKQIEENISGLNKEKGRIATGKSNGKSLKEIDKEIKKLERKKQKLIFGSKEKENFMTLNEIMTKRIKESKKKLSELNRLQKQFFKEPRKKIKKQLRDDIDRIEWELIEETLKEEGNEAAIEKLEQIKKSKSKPFFLWKLYFAEVFQRENPGFDVAIGNPPYVKEYTNRRAFDGLHNSPYYQGKMDLWYFFACHCIDIIRNNAVECFIAPNNWVSNFGAKKMREKLLQDVKIEQFIDFGDYKVFDTAGIQTMVYLLKKTKDNNNYSLKYAKLKTNYLTNEDLSLFLKERFNIDNLKFEKYLFDFSKEKFVGKNITFLNSKIDLVTEKITEQGDLYLTDKEVAQGIVMPQDFLNKKNKEKLSEEFKIGDGIFALSNKEKNELNLEKNELELIKPYYQTSNFSKWNTLSENKYWIIYTNSKFKNVNSIDNYPNIKKHLDQFTKVITSDNRPYGLHRARDERFFKGEKIIVARKCLTPEFSYNYGDCYVSATFYVIKTERINMKYLLSLLNSNLIKFWLRFKGKMQGNNYQIDKEPLVNIPIKQISRLEQELFINLVDQTLKITKSKNYLDNQDKQEKVKKLEEEIDQLVYKLYELTPKEIKIVEETK